MADDRLLQKTEAIKAAFATHDTSGSGIVTTAQLVEIMQNLDETDWNKERVDLLVKGAGGGDNGQVRIDDLLSWLFKDSGRQVLPSCVDTLSPANDLITESYFDEIEPTSPKVPHQRKRNKEKKAFAYVPQAGETLYCPESHQTGVLLLRESGSFAYVHDRQAKFSEGVQGDWSPEGDDKVRLQPRTFGYCYEDSLRASEILSVCPVVLLCRDRTNADGMQLCCLPEELVSRYSWMDPTKEDRLSRPETPLETAPAVVTQAFEEYEEPASPKVLRKSKSMKEKRACNYEVTEGEQTYCPRSHAAGMLLLRPNNSFAYVHDNQAKFSEGVQGRWHQEESCSVRLEPQSLGWCYAGRFDLEEVLSSRFLLKLCEDEVTADGKSVCEFPEEQRRRASWLNPTIEDSPKNDSGLEEVEPTSPKIPKRKRRQPEKRANVYKALAGEELFIPETRVKGLLLLRPDKSFAYVHDSEARFSEGVQGDWNAEAPCSILLVPKSFGWCYEESFDSNEIIGISHNVILKRDAISESGRFSCSFSEENCSKFSWLDPSLPE